MKVKLPIQEKAIVNGELIKKINEKEFDIDTSLASQIRFEAKFPELAQNEDLFGYSKRICDIDSLSAGVIISKMKMDVEIERDFNIHLLYVHNYLIYFT